jgi:anti-sigma B factor antagonist
METRPSGSQGQFDARVENEHGSPVVWLSRDLDAAVTAALKETLEQVFERDGSSVVVDLTDLRFIDSTGIAPLIREKESAGEAGRRLRVRGGTDAVRRTLELTGVESLLLED